MKVSSLTNLICTSTLKQNLGYPLWQLWYGVVLWCHTTCEYNLLGTHSWWGAPPKQSGGLCWMNMTGWLNIYRVSPKKRTLVFRSQYLWFPRTFWAKLDQFWKLTKFITKFGTKFGTKFTTKWITKFVASLKSSQNYPPYLSPNTVIHWNHHQMCHQLWHQI